MNRLNFQFAFRAALLIVLGATACAQSQAGKLVFLRGNDVVTANADGTGLRVLVHDDVPKSNPVWSPDGSKISYKVENQQGSSNLKSLGKIVIVNVSDGAKRGLPVKTEEPDGTLVEGMRFIEESGWYGDSAVFATGSANPHVAEYRIINTNSGQATGGYLGYGFTTCPVMAQVAFISDEQSAKGGHALQINGKSAFTVPANADVREMHWSAQCERLGFFLEENTGTSLIVLSGGAMESRVLLPNKDWSNTSIIPAGNTFVISNGKRPAHMMPQHVAW